MGVVRKTASIGTLGMINFRSKKEKLRRAQSALNAEHLAREVAESGFARVETELRRLSKSELKASKQLARLRRSRKVRKADRLSSVLSSAQPVVRDGVETAKTAMGKAAVQGAKHGRRAQKAAKRASHDVRVGAEKAIGDARSALSN